MLQLQDVLVAKWLTRRFAKPIFVGSIPTQDSMIAIDTEYLAEDALLGDTPGPRPNVQEVYCEIMQIGACKLDGNGVEIDVLNITIKPYKLEIIPNWLVTMTGMTPERRQNGIGFAEALSALVEFVADDREIWTFSGDWFVFQSNIHTQHLSNPFSEPFLRAKPKLLDLGITPLMFEKIGVQEMNSGNLYKVLGITLPEIQGVGAHDACHDARSLAYSMYHLLNATQ